MKRTLFLSALLLICFTHFARSQAQPQVQFGLKTGVNLARIASDDFDKEKGALAGFTTGLMARFNPSGVLAIQTELLFTQKGAPLTQHDDAYEATFRLDYLEVPLMLAIEAPSYASAYPRLYVGIAPSFKVNEKLTVNGSVADSDDLVNNSDFGTIVGGGMGIKLKGADFIFDLRYSNSLSSIFPSDDTEGTNRVITASFGMLF